MQILSRIGCLISILIMLNACSGTSTRESTTQYLDNSIVTVNVKTKLMDNLGTDALGIKVKTYKNVVQLSGFVNSSFIKQRAGILVKKMPNVRQVRNDLIVKSL